MESLVELGMDVERIERDDPARFYEALGRVMAALRDCLALNGARNLDWWAGLGGQTWEIEWQEGPFPAEAAQVVLASAQPDAEHDGGRSLRGVVQAGRSTDNPHYAYLTVSGVPVTLRALNPLGAENGLRQLTAQAR